MMYLYLNDYMTVTTKLLNKVLVKTRKRIARIKFRFINLCCYYKLRGGTMAKFFKLSKKDYIYILNKLIYLSDYYYNNFV